ncbi:MAG: LGFP repeat-containing protein [Dehalococcoidia bacterium]
MVNFDDRFVIAPISRRAALRAAGAAAVIAGAAVAVRRAGRVAGAEPEQREIQPYGLIGEKWHAMGGPASPFGGPVSEEYSFPGPADRSRKQDFEYGQIGWSPAQGDRMLVWCYTESDHVVFGWGPTHPFSYDFFIVRWGQGGLLPVPTDRQEDINSGGVSGYFRVPIPKNQIGSDGRHAGFTFIVEGADGRFLGSSVARQGWTIPVGVRA